MSKFALIYTTHKARLLPSLTLDDMLISQGMTHAGYRRWLKQSGEPLPPLSTGLQYEIVDWYQGSRTDTVKHFNITMNELHRALYCTKASRTTLMQDERAAVLREQGYTEEQIIQEGLAPDVKLLSAEITLRRAKGESARFLAELYNYTPGRISQLDQASDAKKRLTLKDKQAIRDSEHSAQQLAKQYGCATNTIYVIRREQ